MPYPDTYGGKGRVFGIQGTWRCYKGKEQDHSWCDNGEDSRPLLIIGPCSADIEDSVIGYIFRIREARDENASSYNQWNRFHLCGRDAVSLKTQISQRSSQICCCRSTFCRESAAQTYCQWITYTDWIEEPSMWNHTCTYKFNWGSPFG